MFLSHAARAKASAPSVPHKTLLGYNRVFGSPQLHSIVRKCMLGALMGADAVVACGPSMTNHTWEESLCGAGYGG